MNFQERQFLIILKICCLEKAFYGENKSWVSIVTIVKAHNFTLRPIQIVLFISYIYEHFAYMYVYAARECLVPADARGTGVTDGCELLCRCWDSNPDLRRAAKALNH